jgi:CDP-diacylglycerol--glycerol-3-phosphate 3-phosphatidyltransferase
MGKSDRALVFGLLGLFLGAGVAPGVWLSAGMALVALLLLLTIANRVRQGIAEGSTGESR